MRLGQPSPPGLIQKALGSASPRAGGDEVSGMKMKRWQDGRRGSLGGINGCQITLPQPDVRGSRGPSCRRWRW